SSPTGTVTFMDGATTLGTDTVSSSGGARFSTSSLSVGAHSITAVYSGDSAYNASTSAAITQTVNKAATTITLTSSANPSTPGQTITLTAAVSPAGATGTVAFLDGQNALNTAMLTNGIATFTTSSLSTATHSI